MPTDNDAINILKVNNDQIFAISPDSGGSFHAPVAWMMMLPVIRN